MSALASSPSDPITVGVDIDGPLYQLVPALRERIHRTTGRPLHTMPEPRAYDLTQQWNLGPTELVDQMTAGVREGSIFWKGDAYLPGLDGLRTLKDVGYRVVLITARDLPGIENLCRTATEYWLASVGAVYDDLYLTSDKNSVAHDFLVDDYERNVRAALASGRGAALMDFSWNVHVDLPKVTWSDIPALVAAARRTAA